MRTMQAVAMALIEVEMGGNLMVFAENDEGIRSIQSQSAVLLSGVPLRKSWGGGSHSVGSAMSSQPTATRAGMATYQTELPESELPMMATSKPAKMHATSQASLLAWVGDVTRGGPGISMAHK